MKQKTLIDILHEIDRSRRYALDEGYMDAPEIAIADQKTAEWVSWMKKRYGIDVAEVDQARVVAATIDWLHAQILAEMDLHTDSDARMTGCLERLAFSMSIMAHALLGKHRGMLDENP